MSSEATKGQTPDIYGQLHPVETPELIAKAHADFDRLVESLPPAEKKGLLQAQAKCPQLLTDDFKLQFLRCEVFNADLAAKRYAHYWDKRVDIFGPEKAFEPITLKAACVDDTAALECGFINLTGTKDPKGRSIVYLDPSKQDKFKYTRESMCRALWYVLHTALATEIDTQKHGVVFVVFPHHAKMSQIDRGLMKLVTSSIKACLPIRLSAMHICHPPTFFAMVFPLMKLFMGERLRKRIQVHTGNDEKVLNHIEKFGLTRDTLPTDLGGTVTLNPKEWVQTRLAAET